MLCAITLRAMGDSLYVCREMIRIGKHFEIMIRDINLFLRYNKIAGKGESCRVYLQVAKSRITVYAYTFYIYFLQYGIDGNECMRESCEVEKRIANL